MDTATRRWLRDSLEERLETDSREHAFGLRERVRWLAAHLVEYVDRWWGFIDGGLPADSALAKNLFEVIDIGAEVVGVEMRDGGGASDVADAWENFVASLGAARDDFEAPRARAASLRDTVRELHALTLR